MALPKNLKLLAALGISTALANEIGLPLSLDSASAKRCKLASSNSEILIRIRLRSSKVVCDQLGKADFAAMYAFSTSSFEEFGICPYISPFDGL